MSFEKKRNKKIAVVTTIAAVMVVSAAVFGIVYFNKVKFYRTHFLPGTKIGGILCERMTVEDTARLLQERYARQTTLSLCREGETVAELHAADAGITFDVTDDVAKRMEEQNEYSWPMALMENGTQSGTVDCDTTLNEELLESYLVSEGLFDESKASAPENAYIGEYIEGSFCYELVQEKDGTLLDKEKTLRTVRDALRQMDDSVDLSEEDCYVKAEITKDNAELLAVYDRLNAMVGTRITYDWNANEVVVDGDTIHEWISFDGQEITLDEDAIAAFVAEQAKKYDTYGKRREFVTTGGETVTLSCGAYGWRTNRKAETAALIEMIKAGGEQTRVPEYTCTGWAKGMNDIGSSYVEIDLTAQHLYLYLDGKLILESDVVSGDIAKDRATPAGVFGIAYKAQEVVLKGPDYESPVHYWMPFNGGIGMHDATWRANFGGKIYRTNGSHGCVNLPLDKAEQIYGYVTAGFPVVCYYE